MSIPYPTKPWFDGQTFTYQLPNGSDVTATFDQLKMLGLSLQQLMSLCNL